MEGDMSNKTVFVPVDPEGFGCGLLLGLIIRFWRQILIAGVVLFGCFWAVIFLETLSNDRAASASATEAAQWQKTMAEATQTVQAALASAEASAPVQLPVGDSWSGGGLTIRVSNPSFDPACEAAFAFDLLIQDETGSQELNYLDAGAPAMIVQESSGFIYSSQNQREIWFNMGEPSGDCSGRTIQDDGSSPYYMLNDHGKQIQLAIRVFKHAPSGEFNRYYGRLDPETRWISVRLPQIIPVRNVEWIVPVSGTPVDPGEPMATEAPALPVYTEIPGGLPTAEAPVQGNGLSFIYPVDQQVLGYEGDYVFEVTPVDGASGYLWGFMQNGGMVWENMRDEGAASGASYRILEGSTAHSKFVPGPVEVWVRARVNDEWTEAVVITIYLEP
jgi:hypothetical protein